MKMQFAEYLEESGAAFLAMCEQQRKEIENFTLVAPPPKRSKVDAEYLNLVHSHIECAQCDLEKLPESQRRGLTLETMRHFGFGYCKEWVHPMYCTRKQFLKDKADKKKRYTSRRIIIPTPNHYAAVLIDADRPGSEPGYRVLHTAGVELFNAEALNESDLIIVVEGEIDCASIWQATSGAVACVACPGANQNHLLSALEKDDFKGKKFLVVFDNDLKDDGSNPGQEKAKILVGSLIKRGYPAVSRIFENVMAKAEIDACADSARKIDANRILRQKGNEFLNELVTMLIDDSRADFDDAAKKVLEIKAQLEAEKKARQEREKAKVKVRSIFKRRADFDFGDFDRSAEFDRLVDEISSISPESLEQAGYLEHSENGSARPNGYICPFCGSGTHRHKTGALSFEVKNGVGLFNCHACNRGGSVFGLLAEHYGLNKSGKDFLELLKRAADEFLIPYDERLFTLPEKKSKAQRAQEAIEAANAARAEAKTKLDELRDLPDTPENREAIRKELFRICEWHRDKYNQPTTIKATIANMDLIFDNDKSLQNFIGYNEFTGEMVALKDLAWRSNSAGTEWTDRDEAQFRTFLRRIYCELKSPETIHDCLIDLSQRNAFHPVKDFFNALPDWDGKPRAETLFIDFLKADDTPFVREVTLNWLTAAIARIFYPGVNYQIAPILLGKQEIGKSYLLSMLGGKWYGSLEDDVSDPHAVDAIQRLWLCEIKEMAAMKKDVDANKRFIDTAIDNRRAPYDRYPSSSPRHCVFAITTNNRQCLTDMTGNRRYPVIECKATPDDFHLLEKDFIAQIWAEVYQLFKEKFDGVRDVDSAGRRLGLSREVKKQVLATAETFTRDDGLESVIKGFLDTPILPQAVWHLLTREERRKFISQAEFSIDADLLVRRFNSKKRTPDERAEFEAATQTQNSVKFFNDGFNNRFTFLGTELRQHISAAEIYEECFGSDRRKTPARIYEILSQLDDWKLGNRIQNDDPYYRDQKKVYYRQPDGNADS